MRNTLIAFDLAYTIVLVALITLIKRELRFYGIVGTLVMSVCFLVGGATVGGAASSLVHDVPGIERATLDIQGDLMIARWKANAALRITQMLKEDVQAQAYGITQATPEAATALVNQEIVAGKTLTHIAALRVDAHNRLNGETWFN